MDLGQLHIQVLVHRVQRARESNVILELYRDLLPHQRLEERVEQLEELAIGVRAGGRRIELD